MKYLENMSIAMPTPFVTLLKNNFFFYLKLPLEDCAATQMKTSIAIPIVPYSAVQLSRAFSFVRCTLMITIDSGDNDLFVCFRDSCFLCQCAPLTEICHRNLEKILIAVAQYSFLEIKLKIYPP